MRLTSNRLALAICAYFIALAVFYALETPIFEAPDEGAHFLYVDNLLKTGQLPVLEDRDTVFASRSVQRHHPPLYYLTGAALVSWTQRADVDSYFQRNPFGAVGFVSANNQNIYLHQLSYSGDTHVAVWVLRLYSLALGTATLWLVYRAGQIAFPGKPVGLLSMAFAASIPGFVAGSASINNDNLVTMLFAAGIYWSLRMWRRGAITRADIAVVSLILAASALAKLTGVALFPLVYGALVLGVYHRRYPLRQAALLVGVSLLAAALLAGWWYARNWALYGDPLALYSTLRIWGRGRAVSEGLSEVLFEAKGVWDSFWMTLGHFNIRGPEWFYGYVPLVTILGLVGLVGAWWRSRQRDGFVLLAVTCLTSIVALAAATRQINVSQGRILYPMLAGFAPLMALGWRTLLGRRLSALLLVPLALVALATPVLYLDEAYPDPDFVSQLPADAAPVNARAETLTLLGYHVDDESVVPGETISMQVYFSGRHGDNPALFVKAVHPVTQETLGGVDLYPGMAPTSGLREGVIYRAEVDFTLDQALSSGLEPLQLQLAVGWRVLTPEPGRYLQWQDADGRTLDILLLDGPTLIDPALPEATPQQSATATFGGVIRLAGYTVPPSVRPGETLALEFAWEALAPMDANYTLTVGMVDSGGKLVAQSDGMPDGYPTSAWQVGDAFTDAWTLAIPRDLPPGTYRLYVGWYSTPDITRLAVQGEGARDNVFYLPMAVEVTAP